MISGPADVYMRLRITATETQITPRPFYGRGVAVMTVSAPAVSGTADIDLDVCHIVSIVLAVCNIDRNSQQAR